MKLLTNDIYSKMVRDWPENPCKSAHKVILSTFDGADNWTVRDLVLKTNISLESILFSLDQDPKLCSIDYDGVLYHYVKGKIGEFKHYLIDEVLQSFRCGLLKDKTDLCLRLHNMVVDSAIMFMGTRFGCLFDMMLFLFMESNVDACVELFNYGTDHFGADDKEYQSKVLAVNMR